MASKCDRCGEVATDIDTGFSPGRHEMKHADCGGTWRVVPDLKYRPSLLPTPIENLLPLALRRAYMTDNVVNVAFQRAAQLNFTREQALIDAVQLLSDDRQRLQAELTRVMRERSADPWLSTETSGAPGHTLCDYEACDQEPTVTLPKGAVMCAHHAAVALLAGMSPEEARSTFTFARPVPENPWPQVPTDTGTQVPEDEASELIFVNDPTPGKARDWFFTFGHGHSWGGESLGRYYVRLHGTARDARREMVATFGAAWSHQYPSATEAGVDRFGLSELKVEPRDG